MKKWMSFWLCAALFAVGGASVVWANESVHAEGELLAGMHAEDVTPPIGVPLAGFGGGKRRLIPWDVFNKHRYATFLKPSNGKLDPIRSKALVLEREGSRLVFVSLDIVGSDPRLRRDVIKKVSDLGVTDTNLMIAATHTHSGPGTLFKNPIWEFIAADRYQKRIYRAFVEGVATSVRKAVEKLEKAELLASGFEAQGLQKNRRIKDGPVDRQAHLLWVRALSGKWLGVMTNLALHGTELGTDNRKFSADVLGKIEHSLEDRLGEMNVAAGFGDREEGNTPVALFINGAEGDVTPDQKLDTIGGMFADQAFATLPAARPVDSAWSIRKVGVSLPKAGLNVKGCVEQKTLKKLIFWKYRLYLGAWMHRDTQVWSVRLGDQLFMTWPGEPTTALGLQLKKVAQEAGHQNIWLMGLTNDHMSYFTTREEYNTGGYEACATLHGYKGGERLISAHEGLLKADAGIAQ